jgi:large subunit ribosomal protein L6
MSRIGKQPIFIPSKVVVEIQGSVVSIEGPKGKLKQIVPRCVNTTVELDKLIVTRVGENSEVKALHGLTRSLLNNMVKGVSEGFVKKLEIHGVGFKAVVKGKQVDLALGFSHQILFNIPDQIKVTVDDNTKLTIEGPDKQIVGQVAAEIRHYYPPEPYKGKGVRYLGEHIIRKEGKTVQ